MSDTFDFSGLNNHDDPTSPPSVVPTNPNALVMSPVMVFGVDLSGLVGSVGISAFQGGGGGGDPYGGYDPSPDDGVRGLEIIVNPDGTLTITHETNGWFDYVDRNGQYDASEPYIEAGTSYTVDADHWFFNMSYFSTWEIDQGGGWS